MKLRMLGLAAVLLLAGSIGGLGAGAAHADANCTATGFAWGGNPDLTAALINPPETVSGEIDATGCDVAVFFSAGTTGRVNKADIHGALYIGVLAKDAAVDVLNSSIHEIGDSPLTGNQRGVAIYYRDGATGKISGNHLWNYQKGGIVANFTGTNVRVMNNTVEGQGAVGYIAQNGIQIGYGATAAVMRNTVTGHSYTGTSTVSGGIIVVGGPLYGEDYSTNVQIVGNSVANNDIGIFLTNITATGDAPDVATNIKVINNTISSEALTNNYLGFGYQAGISDVGNNDKIINNRISGPGYDPDANPGAHTVAIDADASFTNNAKVHANRID